MSSGTSMGELARPSFEVAPHAEHSVLRSTACRRVCSIFGSLGGSSLEQTAHGGSRRASAPPSILPGRPDRQALRTLGYRLGPAAKIRRSRYKSRTRGMTNTRPHHRPVAQSTTTMTAIQTASSSRITSDDLRCRRSQFIVVLRYDQLAFGHPRRKPEVLKSPAPTGVPADVLGPERRRTGRSPHTAMSEQLVITSAKSAIMSTSLTGLALRRPCAEYPDVGWIICAHVPPGGTLAVRLGSPLDRLLSICSVPRAGP